MIEQLYGTVDKQVEIYTVQLRSTVIDSFIIQLQCINAEKPVITYLPNPRIPELKQKHNRLRRLTFSDESSAEEKLPVHIILGAADIQRIKSTEPAVLGTDPDMDPGADFTMLGWVIGGKVTEKGFFLSNSQEEFKQMC